MEAVQTKKTKARSPQYPAIGLKEAVEKIEAIYRNDYQNPISRLVVASHMGYNGLNGKSLGVLSALGKFGLLEGRGEENRLTDLALKIIAHPPGTAERIEALKEAAIKPELFSDLDARFSGGRVSDAAIRSYLLTEKFIPSAADSAIRSYRETKQLVEVESAGYTAKEDSQGENLMHTPGATLDPPAAPPMVLPPKPSIGARQAIFALTEGDVIITFPEDLSSESVEDLESYIKVFMTKAKREAGIGPTSSNGPRQPSSQSPSSDQE